MSQFLPTGTDVGQDVDGSGLTDLEISQETSSSMIIVSVIYMVLSGITVIARLISRKIIGRNLSISDYLCLFTLLGAWAEALLAIKQANLGLGRHVHVVSADSLRDILLLTYISGILYPVTIMLIKLSILLLYHVLMPGRDVIVASYIIGLFVVMWGTAVIAVSIFYCSPAYGFWDFTIKSTCDHSISFFVGNAIPNIVADIAILAIPVYKIYPLQMSIKSKVAVLVMFLLGSFVIVASGLRIHFILKAITTDLTYTLRDVALWAVIEVNVAVISASLPTIRPLLKFCFDRLPLRKTKNVSNGLVSKSGSELLDQNRIDHWPSSETSRNSDSDARFDSNGCTVGQKSVLSFDGETLPTEQLVEKRTDSAA